MWARTVLTDQAYRQQSSIEAFVSNSPEPLPSIGCTNSAYDPSEVDTTIGFDTGDITVGGLDGSAVVLQPSLGGPYGVRYQAAGSVPQPLFQDGNTLTATSIGGVDLGVFQTSLPTPAAMELTTPTPGASIVAQSPSAVMPIRWNPEGGDLVVITLTPADPFFLSAVPGTMAMCVTSDSGSFDIPASALGPVHDGAILGQNAFLGVTRSASVTTLLSGGSQAVLRAERTNGASIKLQ